MSSPVFDLLERKYRAKRQLYMLLWVPCFALFALLMLSAVSVVITGVDEPLPSYWTCTTSSQAACLASYQATVANRYAEGRATFAAFPGLFGLLFFALWWPIRNKDAPALVRLLRDRPQDAVWVYIKKITLRRNGVTVGNRTELVVGGLDRKQHILRTDPHEAERVMPDFQALLPHATLGHDEERAARFMRDPASMRRAGGPQAAPQGGPQGGPQGAPQPAPPHGNPHAAPQAAPGPAAAAGPLRIFVAPQVAFGHLDQALRGLGLTPEGAGPLVAPGEPSGAAWSASWARVVYRCEPGPWTRTLELYAQDAPGLRARIAQTGLPISG